MSRASPLIACAAAMLVVHCGDEGESEAPCACLADPAPRCVVEPDAECRNSSECPGGLICRETVDSGKRCRPEAQTTRPTDTLTAGFHVPRMRLTGDSATEPGVFRWSPVPGAEYVSCALFACLPEVGIDDRGVSLIVNYDKCVLARETMPIEPVVPFTVGGDSDTAYRPDPTPPARCVDEPLDAPRRITRLVVGCIAYNTTDLVAASRLLFVGPDETGTFGGAIPASADCLEDQTDCYDAESDTFGTCLEGRCQARCLTAADCCESIATDARALTLQDGADERTSTCPGGDTAECVLQDPPVIGACKYSGEGEESP